MEKIYHTIGILAHVDSGKTTFTEQLLYLTGEVRRAGSVDDGTAATDHLAVEKQRGISVRTSTASAVWNGVTINLIDTPGHVEFAGEVERSLWALDYAVVLVSAVEGVRAHTEHLFHALDAANLPRMVFINKIDRAGADTAAVLRDLAKLTKAAVLPLTTVENEGLPGYRCTAQTGEAFGRAVTEALCEQNEEAEEAFLSDTVLPPERAEKLVRDGIRDGTVLPVLCGCAKDGLGIREAADFMTSFMPSSERRATDDLCGVIFKIEHDPAMGKLAHIRLFGGKIENRDEIQLLQPADERRHNPLGEEEDAVEAEEIPPVTGKVTQIRKITGGRYVDAGEVQGGDTAALCGLSAAKTGQFVGSLELSQQYRLAAPFLRVQVTPSDGDAQKLPALAAALQELSDEEPYLHAQWENGQREITIAATGKMQIEILDALLRERYGLTASFSPPTVIYKETPARAGYAYADYTMPKPCWAVVRFLFEPMPRGYGVSYHGKLPSNQCMYRYQTHIRTSFYQCLEQGLYGWEVTDFRCTLVGGEHHSLHTHPLDFFVCTPMAFMNGLSSLGSTLLEPLLLLRISVPMELSGRVIHEVTRMDGTYETPLVFGDTAVLEAIVPVATSMDFPAHLASMTGGRGVLHTSFYGYRPSRDGQTHTCPRRGVNPLDRSRYILWARGAYQLSMSR